MHSVSGVYLCIHKCTLGIFAWCANKSPKGLGCQQFKSPLAKYKNSNFWCDESEPAHCIKLPIKSDQILFCSRKPDKTSLAYISDS